MASWEGLAAQCDWEIKNESDNNRVSSNGVWGESLVKWWLACQWAESNNCPGGDSGGEECWALGLSDLRWRDEKTVGSIEKYVSVDFLRGILVTRYIF